MLQRNFKLKVFKTELMAFLLKSLLPPPPFCPLEVSIAAKVTTIPSKQTHNLGVIPSTTVFLTYASHLISHPEALILSPRYILNLFTSFSISTTPTASVRPYHHPVPP